MLTHKEIIERIDNQRSEWRRERDIDEDYLHGRQRNEEMIRRNEARGIKINPIDNQILLATKENVAIIAENRKNARLTYSGHISIELHDALNEKLRLAERDSGCDRVLQDIAFVQCGVGLEYAEVHRSYTASTSPYMISMANRNEVFRDENVPISEWQRGRWMYQRKNIDWKLMVELFPKKKTEIERLFKTGQSYDWQPSDGGSYTGYMSGQLRDYLYWTKEEERWYNRENGNVSVGCAYQKETEERLVVQWNNQIFPLDTSNDAHLRIAGLSNAKVFKAPVDTLYREWFCGPLNLGKEIISSGKFPLVPFYYFVDGRTGVPYGLSYIMRSLTDEKNARVANDMWNLGSMRGKFIAGALQDPKQHAENASKPGYQVVLKPEVVKEFGGIDAVYQERREFEISAEQARRTQEIRQALKEHGGMSDGTEKVGSAGAPHGLDTLKPGRSNSILLSNFDFSRMACLERLFDMVMEDSVEEETVFIPPRGMAESKEIHINKPDEDGTVYNDVRMYRGSVELEDIPSSPQRMRDDLVYIAQMTSSIDSDAVKIPMALAAITSSSIPYKETLYKAVQEAMRAPTEQEIQQMVEQARKEGAADARIQIEREKLEIQKSKVPSELDKMDADTELTKEKAVTERGTQLYTAMQNAEAVSANPGIVPPAQEIVDSMGFKDQNERPVVSEMPVARSVQGSEIRQNTSPLKPALPESPVVGVNEGIEEQGNQI